MNWTYFRASSLSDLPRSFVYPPSSPTRPFPSRPPSRPHTSAERGNSRRNAGVSTTQGHGPHGARFIGAMATFRCAIPAGLTDRAVKLPICRKMRPSVAFAGDKGASGSLRTLDRLHTAGDQRPRTATTAIYSRPLLYSRLQAPLLIRLYC